MVSLAICRRCWEVVAGMTLGPDEHYLGEGAVPCPAQLIGEAWGAKLSSPPPPHCPYKLEHGVAEAM